MARRKPRSDRGRTLDSSREGRVEVQALESRLHLAADVVINEIMHHPVDPAHPGVAARGLEYIELFNRGDAAANLGNWKFTAGIGYTFAPGTTLGAGQYLVVAANVGQLQGKYPGVSNVVGDWVGRLSNSRETLELRDGADVVVDTVSYADQGDWGQRVRGPEQFGHRGWRWRQAADGSGASLELVNSALSNNQGQNWQSSTAPHGTPGAANSAASGNIAPMVVDLKQTPVIPTSSQAVTVSVRLVDETPGADSARLFYRADAATPPAFSSVAMHDDGVNGDAVAGDGTWVASIPAMADNTIVEFYVSATDGVNTRTWPAPTDEGQAANLLYQVDDTAYTGGQRVYKLIMTERERAELEDISQGSSDPANEQWSDAAMNGTLLVIDGQEQAVRYNVSFRNRGQGSRTANPPNYHIDIPTDRTMDGLSAVNLNSRYAALEVIGSALFRQSGLAAQDAFAAQVRVNNVDMATVAGGTPTQMYGSYAALEALNTEFPDNHYPLDSGGNLYGGFSGLQYLGPDEDSYRHASDITDTGYEKETNTEDDDWSDIIALTRALDPSTTPDSQYVAAVLEHVDVQQWMRFFALNELIGNRENSLPVATGDDYSLYRGVVDPRFELIVHDLDTILGLGSGGGGETDPIFRAGNNPVIGRSLPIVERFLKHPAFVPIYYAQLRELAATTLAPQNVGPLIDNVLGGYVPEGVRASMKTFIADRIAHVMGLIPTGVTAGAPGLAVQNGYPRTTGAAANLEGRADPVATKTVLVNGQPAQFTPHEGRWSLASVPLSRGLNKVVVQALDADGNEVARTNLDVWRDVAATSVSGTLAANTRWTLANSPYRVTANITVPAGVTLTIDPGVTVFFDAGTSITFTDSAAGQGRLVAEGSAAQRIQLTRTPGATGNWGGLRFTYATARPTPQRADNRIAFADIAYSDSGSDSITMSRGKIDIDNVRWANHNDPYIDVTDSSLVLTNSFLPGIGTGELIHFWGFPADGYSRFVGNTFGRSNGYNDIIDFTAATTGGHRPGPTVYFIDNVFQGGADDGIDLDGTDAHVEGNLFMNFHQDGVRDSKSHAVSTGTEYDLESNITVVRNIFYDLDHGVLVKDGGFATIVNNTFVKIHKVHADATTAAINLYETRAGQWPGDGVYADGNIFHDVSRLLERPTTGTEAHLWTNYVTDVRINRSVLPADLGNWAFTGTGNVTGDPQLVNTSNVTDPWADFALRPGPGPAAGTGPNGRDMGALVPGGASISGEPMGMTWKTDATLRIGGPDIFAYKWRLSGGAWSAEVANSDPGGFGASLPPVVLSGLANGSYTVQVITKNSAGVWQGEAEANSSRTWTVNTGLAPRVILSEVLADSSTLSDSVEVYNDGGSAINLAGMSLSDNPASPRKFVFGNVELAPGQRYVVSNLGFGLSAQGEGVWLFNTPGNGGGQLDSVVFGAQLEDYSVAHDEAGNWRLATPSLGSANTPVAMGDQRQLRINEWLTSGVAPFNDDFVELYNTSQYPIDLGGLYLTDRPDGDPAKHRVPALTFVKGGGHFAFIADNDPAEGADHLNFRLAQQQGLIGLFGADGKQIDRVLYGPQRRGVSQGRAPDGSGSFSFFATPNPGTSNPAPAAGVSVEVPLTQMTHVWKYWGTGATGSPPVVGGVNWKAEAYPDANWSSGAGLLYIETAALPAPKSTALPPGTGTTPRNTYYFRSTFTLDADPSSVTELALDTVLDDGAVIYINGEEVFRIGMNPTATITDASNATRTPGDASLESWVLPQAAIAALRRGINHIAVEVHQSAPNPQPSSDVVWGGKLTATVNATVSTSPMRITEVNFNPPGGGGTLLSSNDYEFIEVKNTGSAPLSLTGMRFDAGVAFSFAPGATLAPGAVGVIVKNPQAFASRYGSGVSILGTYADSLDNSGELVRIVDANGLRVAQLAYSGTWQAAADGAGHSLVVIDENADETTAGAPINWAASRFVLGSPGVNEPVGVAVDSVLVNEVLSNSDAGGDWIELHNMSGADVDVSGWYLSDSAADSFKYRIPAGTVVPAGGYLVLSELEHFGQAGGAGVATPFALSQGGEAVYLSASGSLNVLSGYRQHAVLSAADLNVTQGRHTVGATGQTDFVALGAPTPGAANAAPKAGPVVINEIMYHPQGTHPEFIELRNVTGQAVPLFDPTRPANTWRFTDGIDFEFPQGVSIPAFGMVLVVAMDPAQFRAAYNVPAGVQVFGPFALNLDNAGERLELSKPAVAQDGPEGAVVYVPIDHVSYGTSGVWPSTPDGGGASLSRVGSGYGNDPANWAASAQVGGTPGRTNVAAGNAPVISGVEDGAATFTGAFTGGGSFSDPDAGQTWMAAVDYGDGTGTRALTLAADKTFVLSHAYKRSGVFDVTVTISDSGGASAASTVQVTVAPEIGNSSGQVYHLGLNAAGTELEVYTDTGSGVPPAYVVPVSSGTSRLTLAGGGATVVAGGDLSAAGLILAFDEGTFTLGSGMTLASLDLLGGAGVTLAAGGAKVLRLGGLSMTPSDFLDLTDNAVVVAEGDLAEITALIASGLNDGAWDGNGIRTSRATGASAARGIGAVLNDDGTGSPLFTSFGGFAVGTDDVLVKYTYDGDANLDGRVNISDFFRIDAGTAMRRTGWLNGDFNYSGGRGDADDYMLIDRAFLGQGQPAGGGPAPLAAAAPSPVTQVFYSPAQPDDDERDDQDRPSAAEELLA